MTPDVQRITKVKAGGIIIQEINMNNVRKFTHQIIVKLAIYKKQFYEFLGPAPSETKW
jgi:hypothetical protein